MIFFHGERVSGAAGFYFNQAGKTFGRLRVFPTGGRYFFNFTQYFFHGTSKGFGD
jgi:hypothetical protein